MLIQVRPGIAFLRPVAPPPTRQVPSEIRGFTIVFVEVPASGIKEDKTA